MKHSDSCRNGLSPTIVNLLLRLGGIDRLGVGRVVGKLPAGLVGRKGPVPLYGHTVSSGIGSDSIRLRSALGDFIGAIPGLICKCASTSPLAG